MGGVCRKEKTKRKLPWKGERENFTRERQRRSARVYVPEWQQSVWHGAEGNLVENIRWGRWRAPDKRGVYSVIHGTTWWGATLRLTRVTRRKCRNPLCSALHCTTDGQSTPLLYLRCLCIFLLTWNHGPSDQPIHLELCMHVSLG